LNNKELQLHERGFIPQKCCETFPYILTSLNNLPRAKQSSLFCPHSQRRRKKFCVIYTRLEISFWQLMRDLLLTGAVPFGITTLSLTTLRNEAQRKEAWHNNTQQIDTQLKDTRHNDTKHYNTQHHRHSASRHSA
jgi:hypothetical protein